jgi:uncharacterized membrane protein YbhN (UPF0104 family)
LPDATPTSTAPSSRARRNRLLIAAQVVVAAVILWFVGKKVVAEVAEFRSQPLVIEPRWGMIALAAAIMLGAFGVLIETWRRIIIAWGDKLSFADASRIWFVSNLVRYAPGSTLVQLGAMAHLSRKQQISPTAATGASVINVAVNIATGFIVALTAGYDALDLMSHHRAAIGVVIAIATLIGVLALPLFLPRILAAVQKRTGKVLVAGHLPMSAIYLSLAGNLVAWTLYGLSYMALVAGVTGTAPGSVAQYVAVYAAAYVLGYLVFFLPAGAGVREGVQIAALPLLGLTGPQATVVSIAARLLSIALEVIPGFFFFTRGTRSRHQELTERNGSKP